jgi:hypothetical protein
MKGLSCDSSSAGQLDSMLLEQIKTVLWATLNFGPLKVPSVTCHCQLSESEHHICQLLPS